MSQKYRQNDATSFDAGVPLNASAVRFLHVHNSISPEETLSSPMEDTSEPIEHDKVGTSPSDKDSGFGYGGTGGGESSEHELPDVSVFVVGDSEDESEGKHASTTNDDVDGNNGQAESSDDHLESMLQLMYYLGASPYRKREGHASVNNYLGAIMLTYCTLFSILALAKNLMTLKDHFMYACYAHDLKSWTRFGYAMVRSVGRCFFIVLVFKLRSSTVSQKLIQSGNMQYNNVAGRKKFSTLALTLGGCSFFFTTLKVIFGYVEFHEWTFREATEVRAYTFSRVLYWWNFRTFENTTDVLYQRFYLGNFTAERALVAGVDSMFDYCDTLQGELITDFLLVVALVLLEQWSNFESMVRASLDAASSVPNKQVIFDSVKRFEALRQVTKEINMSIGPVFKLVLIQDLLAYAYLFGEIWDVHLFMGTIYAVVSVLKTSVLMYIALKLHRKNGVIKEWLRSLSMYEKRDKEEIQKELKMTVVCALDAMNESPVAVGSDYFVIDEPFLVAFFTAVVSMIGFLVESQDRRYRS